DPRGDPFQLRPALVQPGLGGGQRRQRQAGKQQHQEWTQQQGGLAHGGMRGQWGRYVSTGHARAMAWREPTARSPLPADAWPGAPRHGAGGAQLDSQEQAATRGRVEEAARPTIWTVGHSTRPWEEFVELLRVHRIEAVGDVRRFPGSRRYPWFASESLARALPEEGIGCRWLPQLGGRRRAVPGSPNGAWRNAAFQGYADHMASAEFAEGLA